VCVCVCVCVCDEGKHVTQGVGPVGYESPEKLKIVC
jgi:hypothetical protein